MVFATALAKLPSMRQQLLALLVLPVASFFPGFTTQANAQSPAIDSVAVSILDRMSAIIGDLHSCSVAIRANYDINSRDLGLVKHSDEQELYLHGPNKLFVRSDGDKGSRNFYYDGDTLSYYSIDKNQYGQIPVPPTIVGMIDSVNKLYGIDFPVADFFYPSFVDDILSDATNLAYLGITKVNGKECYHVAGAAKDKTFQFWIADDAWCLPQKVVIVYTGKPGNPQYEAVMDNWQVNPDLPDAMFTFMAPPRAKKIKLMHLHGQKLTSNKP
jgi:hypothetical protein